MPELPEVHTTVEGIKKTVVGKTITNVWTDYNSPSHRVSDNIKNPRYFSVFRKKVVGTTILDASRRAKNILIHLSNNQTILVHMKMTGHMMYGRYTKSKSKPTGWERETWVPNEKQESPLWDPFNRYIHFVLSFSDNTQLVLSDVRKFAKVLVLDTNELDTSPHLADLGPNPLDISTNIFTEQLLLHQHAPIKQVLMDQHILAGIGNIYSDEALFRASIHPKRAPKTLTEKEFKELLQALKHVLKKGIAFGGDSESDYRNIEGNRGEFQEKHSVYRKKGQRCSKGGCDGVIERMVIGGRSAHFCNTHQK